MKFLQHNQFVLVSPLLRTNQLLFHPTIVLITKIEINWSARWNSRLHFLPRYLCSICVRIPYNIPQFLLIVLYLLVLFRIFFKIFVFKFYARFNINFYLARERQYKFFPLSTFFSLYSWLVAIFFCFWWSRHKYCYVREHISIPDRKLWLRIFQYYSLVFQWFSLNVILSYRWFFRRFSNMVLLIISHLKAFSCPYVIINL